MPVVGLGHKSYLQVAKQSVWETFVAPSAANKGVKLELINWRVEPVIGVIRDPSLYNAVARRALYQGGRTVRGTFTVRCNYEGLEELYRSAFGSYASGAVSGNIQDHVFSLGESLVPLSIECVWGDIPAGKSFNLTGAKMVSMTIRGTAGQGTEAMLTCEFTVLAKDMTSNNNFTPQTTVTATNPCTLAGATITRPGGSFTADGFLAGMVLTGDPDITEGTVVVSPGTTTMQISQKGVDGTIVALDGTAPEFPGLYPVLFSQQVAANLKEGTADAAGSVRVRSFEVTLESPHAEDRFYLSSLDADEPTRDDFVNVRWRFTQEFITRTQYDNARSFATVAARLFFRHPTDLTGSSHFRELELFSNNANIVEWSAPIDGFGAVISTVTLEASHHVGDASAIVLRTRNGRIGLL